VATGNAIQALGSGFGTVTGVTATDASIVVGGTAAAPTIATGTLDVIAAQHPAAANWSNNSKKITSLANATAAADACSLGVAKAYAQCGPLIDMGYVGGVFNWLAIPAYSVPGAGTWAAGVLYLARCMCLPGAAANGYVSCVWVNHASMSNSYIALYDSGGNRLGVTADLSAQGTALIRVACTGFTAVPADGIIYAAYLNGTSGVAGGPVFEATHWNSVNPTTANSPQGAYNNLWPGLSGNAGLSAAPSSITYSSYVARASLPAVMID
jgi:hypothetical protein